MKRVLNRRTFLQQFAGGLAVLWTIDRTTLLGQAESGAAGRRGGARRPKELAAWLHIAADGTVTVFSGKTEVGQNVRTMLTQAVAEELPTPLANIRLTLADTSLVPWDAGTFGSRSTPEMVPQIRRAAATAREALLDLAATRLGAPRSELGAADGHIVHATSSRRVGFGELTRGEKLVLDIADDVALRPAAEWRVLGTSTPKIDAAAYVTGRHLYSTDLRRPGMLHGKVLRAPSLGSTLAALDDAAAKALPGVTVVREGDFVGVTAPDEHRATQALAALRPQWTPGAAPASERGLFERLRATARNAPSASAAAEPAEGELRQTYTVAYIAHAPLEPRAAVAEWNGENVTVWTGSQRPFGVRDELANAFRIPADNVRVIVPDTGSGYGGKHTGEAAVEAARLARAAGKPVKLVWTREEEFSHAYFRPAGVMEVSSRVENGRLTRWEHRNYNSGNAGIRAVYDIPREQRTEEFHPASSPLRQGSYRGLAAAANHFARETHVDEQARRLGADPLEFRLANLRDPRAIAALQAAADKFGWAARERRPHHGYGIAVGYDKGGYFGTCAHVEFNPQTRRVRVIHVVQSFECGAILNPDHLKNQVEGCVIQGLGGALYEAMRFDDGRILNPRFSSYRVPRFSDCPRLEIVLLDRKDLPAAGAGETPLAGIAPALGNALFDATGVRLRALPLLPHGRLA